MATTTTLIGGNSSIIATSTPTPNTVPITDASGTLNSFIFSSTTPLPNAIVVSDGNGAFASWGVAKNNLTATTDPVASNDNIQGYSAGSLWVNTSSNLYWVCVNATTGAAVWLFAGQESGTNLVAALQTFNGQRNHFLGDYEAYTATFTPVVGQVQYYRNWLNAGTVITKMECGCVTGATANINMGIYTEASALPSVLVAQTGTTAIGAGNANSFVLVNLLRSWTVPSSDYYWFAFICDATTATFSACSAARGLPLVGRTTRIQASATTVLPNPAVPAAAANQNTVYVAAVE